MSKQMSKVDSKYGAPMGRNSRSFTGKARCFRLRFVDGNYDDGGAYWGSPANVYCATDGAGEMFCRACNRQAAKKRFSEQAMSKGHLLFWVN